MGADSELRDNLVRVSFAVTAVLSRVAGLVDRAAERGLVQKKAHPVDGRSVRVSLTAKARGLAAVGVTEIGEQLAPLIDRLSPREQNLLSELLEKVLDA